MKYLHLFIYFISLLSIIRSWPFKLSTFQFSKGVLTTISNFQFLETGIDFSEVEDSLLLKDVELENGILKYSSIGKIHFFQYQVDNKAVYDIYFYNTKKTVFTS
jgi:hypothetical protein